LKFRPFDKVERCFDIVASVDRALRRLNRRFILAKEAPPGDEFQSCVVR